MSALLSGCLDEKHCDFISFQSGFYRDLTEQEYEQGGSVKTTFIDSVANDTRYVSVITSQSGCMTFDGDIKIKKDTLYLLYWHDNEEACDERVVYKMDYHIKDPTIDNYVLVYDHR